MARILTLLCGGKKRPSGNCAAWTTGQEVTPYHDLFENTSDCAGDLRLTDRSEANREQARPGAARGMREQPARAGRVRLPLEREGREGARSHAGDQNDAEPAGRAGRKDCQAP